MAYHDVALKHAGFFAQGILGALLGQLAQFTCGKLVQILRNLCAEPIVCYVVVDRPGAYALNVRLVQLVRAGGIKKLCAVIRGNRIAQKHHVSPFSSEIDIEVAIVRHSSSSFILIGMP